MSTRRARPTALVRAEHHASIAHLDAAQKSVLAEALRRAEDAREEVESQLTSFGRWLLEAVFADDPAHAVNLKSDNPVWLELVRRAGGPTLRLSRNFLYLALNVAARDRRIADQAWRGLDVARKELLLPLGDDARLREGAQHVSRFNLTQQQTREYVTGQLKSAGKTRKVVISAPRLTSQLKTFRTSLQRVGLLERVSKLRGSMDAKERAALLAEVDEARAAIGELRRVLRAR